MEKDLKNDAWKLVGTVVMASIDVDTTNCHHYDIDIIRLRFHNARSKIID
jgi:hypothetical protein